MYTPTPELAILQKLLSPSHPQVIETGDGSYGSTATLAQWAGVNPNLYFRSVSLDSKMQAAVHAQLEQLKLAPYCTFLTQDPKIILSRETWIDFALLHPTDLQDGVEQFSLSISAGASTVVIRDFQRAAALAVRKAKDLGWQIEHTAIYSILKRA